MMLFAPRGAASRQRTNMRAYRRTRSHKQPYASSSTRSRPSATRCSGSATVVAITPAAKARANAKAGPLRAPLALVLPVWT